MCESGKTRYKRPCQAEHAAAMLHKQGLVEVGKKLRVYRCHLCGYWHLTSREKVAA